MRKTPCTVVTGFLGAGKTTLLRHLLGSADGRRFAVLVNEFGDVGIDGDLVGCGIASCPEENIVELANGCICCTVADDFEPALEKILALSPPVDHILIETSGLALPKPLVQAFNWPSIRSRVTVDGVVVVADGEALAGGRVAADPAALAAQRAADPALDHDDPVEEVFADQIACADLVVLSKADLLDDGALARARSRLAPHLPPATKVVPATEGRVAANILVGLGAASEAGIDARRTLHDGEEEHDHDEFASFVFDGPVEDTAEGILARVGEAAAMPGVLRIKGFVQVARKPLRLVVQAVGPRVTSHYDRPWVNGERFGVRLVVIGLAEMDRAAVEAVLDG